MRSCRERYTLRACGRAIRGRRRLHDRKMTGHCCSANVCTRQSPPPPILAPASPRPTEAAARQAPAANPVARRGEGAQRAQFSGDLGERVHRADGEIEVQHVFGVHGQMRTRVVEAGHDHRIAEIHHIGNPESARAEPRPYPTPRCDRRRWEGRHPPAYKRQTRDGNNEIVAEPGPDTTAVLRATTRTVGSEEAHLIALVLASVRRSNRTCSFPASGFHEWAYAARRDGISETRLTS
jgi:hypothetical protein